VRRARPQDFDNCILLLICISCGRYIGQGAPFFRLTFDDNPDEQAYMHANCAEEAIVEGEDFDDEEN
jgi:hypothetical protein